MATHISFGLVNLRARYKQEATLDLIDAAIQKAASERGTFEFSDRVGLVAWCLGRFSVFDKLKDL
jgi:hypothetical protein